MILQNYQVNITDSIEDIFKKNEDEMLPDIMSKLQYESNDPLFDENKLLDDIKNSIKMINVLSNDLYDNSKNYIPRYYRREWDPITILGKVCVRDNGKCVPGKKCTCNDEGIAIPSGKDEKGWLVLSRISEIGDDGYEHGTIEILYQS
jgi:hypothetical protein